MSSNIINLKSYGISYVLQLNTTKILINANLNNPDQIPKIEAILITHFETKYINSLLHFTDIPVYMTVPCDILGLLALQDIHENKYIEEYSSNELPDDVIPFYNYSKPTTSLEKIFTNNIKLKYSQPVELQQNITIAAYRAGHSLGGAIWKINKDNENILILSDINHRKENHLDGIDTEIFNNITLCILNVNEKFETIKKNEIIETLKDKIKEKVIIFVNYTRFLELAITLNNILKKKCKVISGNGKNINYEAQGMAEWAGANIMKNSKNIPFDFDQLYYSDNCELDEDVIIVVDESCEGSFAKIVLSKINEHNILFVNTAHKGSLQEKILNGLRNFKMEIPELIPLTQEEVMTLKENKDAVRKKNEEDKIISEFLKTKEECSDDEIYVQDKETAKKMFWYEYKYDFWVEEGNEKYAVFPEYKSLRFDEYGEIFHFTEKEKEKIEEEINDEKIEEHEENINKIIWTVKEINLKNKIEFMDFDGLCDFSSIKNILEMISPQKIVFTGENIETVKFYYYYFYLNKNFEEVYFLENELNLNIDTTLETLKVDDEVINQLDFKTTRNELVAGFKGKIVQDEDALKLEYLGSCSSFILGDLKINEVKRKLIENGYKVEITNNILTVENEVEINFCNNEIMMQGDMNDLYQNVRNIVYEQIVFIN